MSEQTHTRAAHDHTKVVPRVKIQTIKHHHAKAYRKRHVATLALFLVIGLGCLLFSYRYSSRVRQGVASAKEFMSSLFAEPTQSNQTIVSTYGFSTTVDTRKFYTTGIDASSGELYIGNELNAKRAYNTIRIAPSLADTKADNTNLTIHYYDTQPDVNMVDAPKIEAAAIKSLTAKATLQATKVGTSNVELSGHSFIKSDWEFRSSSSLLAGFTPSFTTYTSVVNKKPFVIEIINSRFELQQSTLYDDVLQGLYFGPVQTVTKAPSAQARATAEQSKTLLDTLLLTGIARAQNTTASPNSEIISSTYGPAVVKLFNVYCEDIYVDGKSVINDVCNGNTGSGFFVSQNGYIASNGHVVSSDPKDLLILSAYQMYKRGDTRLLDFMAQQAKITAANLPEGTPQERADYLMDKLYDLDDSRITTKNSAVNLLVCLGKVVPDTKELVAMTIKRQTFKEQATIKQATVEAQDFRSFDGLIKFHASDVALIKIAGQNYPVTKLGTITGLMQGANLSILGYPGNASENGIVDAGQSTVTLTSGKVSAIKNALGSDKKLIETDTLIGHGNSGGPAFNDEGEVMGISTYTAAKTGDGTYNYIRDIQDLNDLAASASIAIGGTSKTQTTWEQALKQFDKAHYSKSLGLFAQVKNMYPAHAKVDDFIAAAQENIKAGKDVKDFPVVYTVIIGVVLLIGAAVVVRIIVRHRRAHHIYRAQLAQGKMQPLQKGDPPVTVAYDADHVDAQKNLQTAGQQGAQFVNYQHIQPK